VSEGPATRPSRSGSAAALALVAAVLIAGGALAFVALRGPAPPANLQERVHAVAAGLRCPVCQNLSVADSPSVLAREMRASIEDRLRAGESPSQIRASFVASYGDWILLDPPARGINLVAWLAPAALLLAGVVLAVMAVRRWTRADAAGTRTSEPGAEPGGGPPTPSALSESDRRRLAAALAESEAEPE